MKPSIDTAQLKQEINLIDLASRYVELRKVSPKEYHGPCPWCGGDNRFRVTADHFACRPDGAGHCGRKGDAIEFIMQKHNVDFRGAVSILEGNLPTVSEVVKPVRKPIEPAYKWDESANKKMALDAHSSLIDQQSGQALQCMAYLTGRGIDLSTIKAFTIGCTPVLLPATWDDGKVVHPRQLAISLPWFNHDGALVAIKYRFTESHAYTDKDGKPRTENKTSRGQASGNVFGWQALQGPDKCDVLIVCEGEMNALSLWQAGAGAVDVLSTGSEATTKTLPPIVVELAKRYKHKIVWADKKEIADAAALQIGAASMGSPLGKDANDWLQAGKLCPMLGKILDRMGVTLPALLVTSQPVTRGNESATVPFVADSQPADDFPDIHTADIFAFVGLNLFADELAIYHQRCAGRFDIDAVKIGDTEDGDLWQVKRISSAGKQLWSGKHGQYVI